MGTTYYIDPAADFVDRTGLDKVGAELTGPGGFQAALRGTGAATKLAAGDTIVIKAGILAIDRLILMDCNGTDVSAWEVGDVVRNKDGAGDDWTGVVIQERDLDATGLAADDILLVQLDSSYTHANIGVADGIENTTKAESADPLASATMPGILWDAITGTGPLPIELIGCSSAWTEKGDTNGTIIDGSVGASTAASLFDISDANISFLKIWNLTFQNCSGVPWDATGRTSSYWWWVHCKFDSTNGVIPSSNDHSRGLFVDCIFANNSDEIRASTSTRYVNCVFRDNTGNPLLHLADSPIVNCVLVGNSKQVQLAAGSSIFYTVLDDTDSNMVDDLIKPTGTAPLVMFTRIVNLNEGTSYAFDGSASANSPVTFEDYNVYYNPNAAGNLRDVTQGANTIIAAEDGVDADLNVERGKDIASTPIVLNWDE